jgi:hypothetical protein
VGLDWEERGDGRNAAADSGMEWSGRGRRFIYMVAVREGTAAVAGIDSNFEFRNGRLLYFSAALGYCDKLC